MRNEASLQELVHFEALEAAFDQVVATSGEFSKVCIALSLDPARDFRFSNLRDVDFSMADLRGFDFRGADLRGSYGSDVNGGAKTGHGAAQKQATFLRA